MRARDIMTRKVHTARPDTPLNQVAKVLAKHRISAVPVIDRRRHVIGIVSENDLLHRAEIGTLRRRAWWLELFSDTAALAREYAKGRAVRTRDVMTRSVISVTPGTDAADVADLFVRHGINRVPVVERGRLVGIVSRGDIVRQLAKRTARPKRRKNSDASIRSTLRQAMKAERWIRDVFINVAVTNVVVELSGSVPDADQRQALNVLAEGVPGVRSVKNRLSVVSMTGYV